MKIQEKDIYHGAALVQIVELPAFKALNKVDAKYGRYVVNTNRAVFIKYSSSEQDHWYFGFSIDDIRVINADVEAGNAVFLVLVCGHKTICALTIEQFDEIINRSSPEKTQTIKVTDLGTKTSLRVSCSRKKLHAAVPHNAFPDIILA